MSGVKIDPDEIREVFRYCHMRTEENFHVDDAIFARGAFCAFRFNRTRLEERRPQVARLLSALPEQFRTGEGGIWTSVVPLSQTGRLRQMIFHLQVDQLLALGRALGLVLRRYPHTRGIWKVL